MVLASAGVLKGRKCAHTIHPRHATSERFPKLFDAASKYFSGSEYLDENVVISENIVTAKPWVKIEFA